MLTVAVNYLQFSFLKVAQDQPALQYSATNKILDQKVGVHTIPTKELFKEVAYE